MARRESRVCRVFGQAIEDIKRQKEDESKEKKGKLRAKEDIVVQEERDSPRSETQQLLRKNKNIQRKLSVTEEENHRLKLDLQKAREEIGQRDEQIGSLHHRLSVLEKKYNEAMVSCREVKTECEKAQVDIQQRDEEIVSLRQSLRTQKEETMSSTASVHERMDSLRWQSIEQTWQKDVSQLKELLSQKDKELSRAVKKRKARTRAHIDTMALLSSTQSALTESKLTCDALQEELRKQLAERDLRHQEELAQRQASFTKQLSDQEEAFKKEISEKAESLRKQLSDTEERCQRELSEVSDGWERRALQWQKEMRELDGMLLVKDRILKIEDARNREEIQLLTRKNRHLQLLLKESKTSMSFRS